MNTRIFRKYSMNDKSTGEKHKRMRRTHETTEHVQSTLTGCKEFSYQHCVSTVLHYKKDIDAVSPKSSLSGFSVLGNHVWFEAGKADLQKLLLFPMERGQFKELIIPWSNHPLSHITRSISFSLRKLHSFEGLIIRALKRFIRMKVLIHNGIIWLPELHCWLWHSGSYARLRVFFSILPSIVLFLFPQEDHPYYFF